MGSLLAVQDKSVRSNQKPKGALRRLFVREDGSAAIEFGFVVMPFLLLLMGVIEIGLASFVSTQLQGATAEAARQILSLIHI